MLEIELYENTKLDLNASPFKGKSRILIPKSHPIYAAD